MTPHDEMPDRVRGALDKLCARITLSEIGIGATYEQDGFRFRAISTRQYPADILTPSSVYVGFAWIDQDGKEWKL